MTSFNLRELCDQLKNATQKSPFIGVSFAGQSLKLDTEKDGKVMEFI